MAGNIGVGKSTLAEILGKIIECPVYEELDKKNPFLEKFYQEPSRWAFDSQMFFLSEKAKKMRQIEAAGKSAIIDRTIYEDINVFARAQKEFKYMNESEWKKYENLANEMTEHISYPDAIIYLRGNPNPTLWERINGRKRAEEVNSKSTLDVEYLHFLNGLYELMIYSMKKENKTRIHIIDTNYSRDDIISNCTKESIIKRVVEKSLGFLYSEFCGKNPGLL
ncbi:MAG: deoxynucleoside kinase [Candidatus Woesearchaeota archaeon]|nr:deoxynucleoside kinase [Candidatus Woesearchaeota archaeon]